MVDHRYTTWVRRKWIQFSPAVIEHYYGLTANDIEHESTELDMTLVTQFLYRRADVWPIVGPKFLHNQLTESLPVFHIFACHNIDPTSYRLGPVSYIILQADTKLTWRITSSALLLILHHSVSLAAHSCFHVSLVPFCLSEGVPLLPHEDPETPEAPITRQTIGNPIAR
ncbi:hypothetical protein Adt_21439 [Abeliophyllum distichum]|uniref:Uncharacterized protein n=1 Tax=Abeliophyllum distichum TaxID=126358 RepID=A0ABD1SZQ8_9LAMI